MRTSAACYWRLSGLFAAFFATRDPDGKFCFTQAKASLTNTARLRGSSSVDRARRSQRRGRRFDPDLLHQPSLCRATARQASEGCRAEAHRAQAGLGNLTTGHHYPNGFSYVYILGSLGPAGGFYVGLTEDLAGRLVKPNAGEVP